jgi:hypothetical protein
VGGGRVGEVVVLPGDEVVVVPLGTLVVPAAPSLEEGAVGAVVAPGIVVVPPGTVVVPPGMVVVVVVVGTVGSGSQPLFRMS